MKKKTKKKSNFYSLPRNVDELPFLHCFLTVQRKSTSRQNQSLITMEKRPFPNENENQLLTQKHTFPFPKRN